MVANGDNAVCVNICLDPILFQRRRHPWIFVLRHVFGLHYSVYLLVFHEPQQLFLRSSMVMAGEERDGLTIK